MTLTGVVAKGLLRNAVVKAHPVAANGSVDTATTLAEAISNDNGQYTLPAFSATAGVPYVIRVTPRPAGQTPATTQLDEISGATDVPSSFVLRALFVPASSGSVSTSASVTPFSEFAVAAAEKGSGGVSAANAAQARINITVLLGFDPTTVTPTTIATAGSNAQQLTLATMLTAVSRMANDSALGCAQATLAERTGCVVAQLGSSASLASTKPGSVSGTDVAAALTAATQAVVTANALPPTAAGIVIDNLQGPGTPPPGNIAADTQSAIAAAKLLFTSLRSDWRSLFSGRANSAAATEADKFSTAMRSVQAPADVLLADAGAVITGIDLYRDFTAGRTGQNWRGRGDARELVAGGNINNAGVNRTATGCALYTDSTYMVRAATPAQAQSIGCQAVYYMRRFNIAGGYAIETWRHGFGILPTATAGSFTYTVRARRSVEECIGPTCTRTVNEALQANFYSGTVTVTADANQRITGVGIAGELPGAFVSGGTALANERHTWLVDGTRTPGVVRGEDSATLTATIVSYAAGSNTPLGTLKVTDGRTSEVAVSRTASGATVRRGHATAVADAGGELATADLPVEWATATSSFLGRLALTDSAWDSSGTSHAPTRVVLSGQFRNTDAANVTTEFLNGSFTLTTTGWTAFNDAIDVSASNKFDIGFQFSGSITAPGRPTLELTLTTTSVVDQEPTSLTAQYRTLVGGSATQTVNISVTKAPGSAGTLAFSEAASNVSLHYVDDVATATLRRGSASNGTELGTLDTRSMLMTFVDGSTMTLDFGL